MTRNKAAQLEIRRDEFKRKDDLRGLVRWLRKVTKELESEASGPWLVRQKTYAPLFRYSLMR